MRAWPPHQHESVAVETWGDAEAQRAVDSKTDPPLCGFSDAQRDLIRKLVRDEIRLIVSKLAQADWRGVANL